jgi:hypothetical protein
LDSLSQGVTPKPDNLAVILVLILKRSAFSNLYYNNTPSLMKLRLHILENHHRVDVALVVVREECGLTFSVENYYSSHPSNVSGNILNILLSDAIYCFHFAEIRLRMFGQQWDSNILSPLVIYVTKVMRREPMEEV